MKKTIIAIMAILVIAMFVLAGCGSSDAEPESKPVPKKSTAKVAEPENEPEPVQRTAPEPEDEPEPEPVKKMSKSMTELLGKHTRVKSMYYMYQDSLNYPTEWPTYVMGNKISVDLREEQELGDGVYVDHIYMNSGTKTAKAYCEKKISRCPDPNQAHDVRYAKYGRKTPLDWIRQVTYAEKEGEETRQQRMAVKIAYEDGDSKVTMWVDEYFGVPMEVRVKKDGDTKSYIFEDLAVNTVDEADIEHQTVTSVYN
ncbi:hypothetical protein ACFL0V_04060 [Nanoarchaeota archaeon]